MAQPRRIKQIIQVDIKLDMITHEEKQSLIATHLWSVLEEIKKDKSKGFRKTRLAISPIQRKLLQYMGYSVEITPRQFTKPQRVYSISW